LRIAWAHLASIFLLLSVVGALGMILVDGLTFVASLARLPALLQWWVPPALGVAAAAMPVRGLSPRRLAALVLVGIGLLILLDLLGSSLSSRVAAGWALVGGESVQTAVSGNVHPESWIGALAEWAVGGLTGVSERLPRYPAGHPRVLVVQALAEAGSVFLVLGIVGLVAALRRWIDENVTLRRPSNDVVVGAVLGWIIAPSVCVAASALTGERMSAALFRGEPLGAVLIPCGATAALGALGLRYALRRDR
jgi:hypothetical protein